MKRSGRPRLVRIAVTVLAAQFLCADASFAGKPSPATTRAYNDYLYSAEARMAEDYRPGGDFISKALLSGVNAQAELKTGQVLIRCVAGCDSSGVAVTAGLIHDWIGVAFIPGVSLHQVLSFAQDYDHAAALYAPDVTKSRLLARTGNSFRVFLQLKQAEVVTVRFDTEYDVRYVRLGASRVYSTSHSTRIAQLAHNTQDRELPPAQNDGFLWRLDSYWRFEEVAGGVYVECRAISLSRDIPAGFGWIVAPFIKNIPRKSLQFTLNATREGVLVSRRKVSRNPHLSHAG
ncbi:MAG TPA: hypothetical protein VMF66_13870 [Candidatus Acidoferrum sp.]|nr:hypothetical protein [Candidatus Acidoferrum sp.]